MPYIWDRTEISCTIQTLSQKSGLPLLKSIYTPSEVIMKKIQSKALATKIHGLAVKSANGKKPAQNKAIERIAALLNQAIEAEIKQAYAGIASQVRGLAEKLEPTPLRRAVKRKKVTRRKPVATKKKPPVRRGRVKPTERVVEQTETVEL
jgi:hypothetical protein